MSGRQTSIARCVLLLAPLSVVPVLAGSLQILLALVPALLAAISTLLLAIFRPSTLRKALKLLWAQKGFILIVVLIVASGQFVARQVRAGRARDAPAVGGAAGSWPMFRGAVTRRGVASNSSDPTTGSLNWSFDSPARTFYASPAVVGNRVYVTSAETSLLFDEGAVYCLDADSGELVWSSAPDGFRATISSPAVSGKYLVCGEGLHFTQDARLLCMDITRQGAIVWQFRTNSHVESSPCIWRDRVCVGAGDDGYYCLALEPTPSGEARVLWHAAGDGYPDAETPPAVWDGKVYVGLGKGGNAVCCLDADTGEELWRARTPYPVFTAPTLAVGKVFVGMGNGNLIENAEQARERELDELKAEGRTAGEIADARERLRPAGEVWCLDAADGTVEWRFPLPRTVLGAIVAGTDRVYFGSRDGNLYCLSYQGEQMARWEAHSPIVASPALGREHVYFVTDDGMLHALRADDLQPVWEARTGSEGPFLSAPAIAHGRLYVGSGQDGLLCLGAAGDPDGEAVWAGPLGGPGRSGCIDGSPIAERGVVAWRYPGLADTTFAPDASVTLLAPTACLGERLYVSVVAGPRRGVACLRHGRGSQSAPRQLWFSQTENTLSASLAADKETVLFVDGKRGDPDRDLCCLDAESGAKRWRIPVGADATAGLLLGPEEVYVQDRGASLACYDLDGKRKWRQKTGVLQGTPSYTETILLAVTRAPPRLRAMDRVTGKTLWEVALSADPRTGPAVRGKVVYVGTAEGMSAYSLVEGSVLWTSAAGPVEGSFALDASYIAYVSSVSDLVVLDPADGRVTGRVPGALPHVPPLLSGDTLLYASRSGLVRYDLSTGEERSWLATSQFGTVNSPLVMADSVVYFACDRAGLVCARGDGAWR